MKNFFYFIAGFALIAPAVVSLLSGNIFALVYFAFIWVLIPKKIWKKIRDANESISKLLEG